MKTLTQLYDEYEGDFIDGMVNRFKFSGKQEVVFRKRFIKDNDGCLHHKLADKLTKYLIDQEKKDPRDQEKKDPDPGQIFRQTLVPICDKLEEMGCPASKGADRWKNCRCWLREEMFKIWAKEQGLIKPKSIDECWQELKEKVAHQEGLTVAIPALGNMGARTNRKRHEIPVNSNLIYRVDFPKPGHLMLFEREPNGTIVCLCPSEFAPESEYQGKETKLPHPNSKEPYFGSDELGWEQLVAVITPELPPLQWLEDSRTEALELSQDHLAEVLDYLQQQPNADVLYTEYLVIAVQSPS